MNTKVLLILALAIACMSAEFNCSNHPMQSPKNKFNISSENWLDVPETASDDLPFCKGMQSHQTCCKPAGFEELKTKYFDDLNEFKAERKRLEQRFDDLRTDVYVDNIDKVLTLQARTAVYAKKLFYNLNGVFFRIAHLFKEIRDWDFDDDDDHDDDDDDHDDDDDSRKLQDDSTFLAKLTTLQESEQEIKAAVNVANQVRGSFRMLQRLTNDTDIDPKNPIGPDGPKDPRGIPNDPKGPEFEKWKDIKYDFPGITWNLDPKQAKKQGLSLWNFAAKFEIGQHHDGELDFEDIIEHLIDKPVNVSDRYPIDADKNISDHKRQLKNATKHGFRKIQELKNRAFNYQKQCMEDMFNIQASMACQVCNAEVGKFAKQNMSRFDKRVINFKYKGHARWKQNTNCYKYYFYYYQLGWVQKNMIEQKVLLNTSKEYLAIFETLSNTVEDELNRFDKDIKMKLKNKTMLLLDIGINLANAVNDTVMGFKKWGEHNSKQFYSYKPWEYYFYQKPWFRSDGSKMVFIPKPFKGMNMQKFFFHDLLPLQDPETWKEKDTVWGQIFKRTDWGDVERDLSRFKQEVAYYRKLIGNWTDDGKNPINPFNPDDDYKPYPNRTDNDTDPFKPYPNRTDDDVTKRVLQNTAGEETEFMMVESTDSDAVDLGADGNNLPDSTLDVKESKQEFDQLDEAENNINVDTSLKAVKSSNFWKVLLFIVLLVIIAGVGIYFARNKISNVIQGDFRASQISMSDRGSQLVTMNNFDKFKVEEQEDTQN